MERPVHATPSQRSDLPRKAHLKSQHPATAARTDQSQQAD